MAITRFKEPCRSPREDHTNCPMCGGTKEVWVTIAMSDVTKSQLDEMVRKTLERPGNE